jgi:hypothetical protein
VESAVQNGEDTPSRHGEKREAADHRAYFLAIKGITSAQLRRIDVKQRSSRKLAT